MKPKSQTMADVARHCGVSQMTVSRVINGDAKVREGTRQRVLDAIKELNYVPNTSARALAGSKSYKIGFLYANPSAFYLSELLVGALEALGQNGHQMMLEKIDDQAGQISVTRRLKALAIMSDGLIVPPPLSDYRFVRDFISKSDLPAVLLSSSEGRGRSRQVCIDDYMAARDITQHLVELGHKDIGFIEGNPNQYSSGERLRGYKDAMQEAGFKAVDGLIEEGLFTFKSGIVAAKKLLSRKNPPTAILASNDDMAAGVLSVAAEKGLRVPDDLSVTGFDDSPIASTVVPRLTTVRQPLIDMATTAVDLLLATIAGTEQQYGIKRAVLGYDLVMGDSTAAPKK